MKKAISLVVALTVVLTCIFNFALADTFTIHNGIAFGMSEEEVKSIEGDKGFEIKEDFLGNLVFGLTRNMVPPFDDKIEEIAGPDDQKYARGSVAGYDGSEIYFNFNDSGLCSVVYHLGGNTDSGRYSTLFGQLKSKYGDSSRSGDLVLDFPVEGLSCFSMYKLISYMGSFISKTVSYEGFEQWVVPTEGGYALVSLLAFVSPSPECYISYNYMSEDVYQSYIQEKVDAQNEKNQQLSDDL